LYCGEWNGAFLELSQYKPCPLSAALTGQNFLQPSYVNDTFLPPSYFRILLKHIQWSWRRRQYIPPKTLE
jgi:hypothetical protein